MDEVVLVKDLPPEFVNAVAERLAAFTVAFIRFGAESTNPPADLLGSGILISVGSTKAILTADHVVEALPKTGRIGLFLGRTTEPHSIDCTGVCAVKIARGAQDALGPDLGAVVLSQSIAGSIGALKSFFRLDKSRHQLLNDPPAHDLGAWFAQGFLEERTTVGLDCTEAGFTKYFYNFTGVGGPDRWREVDAHDYFDFPITGEARITAPIKWGGMSGGGVWQVPVKRTEGALTPLSPLLSGLMFYQHPTTPETCGVRCHGRRSIYEVAYAAIGAAE